MDVTVKFKQLILIIGDVLLLYAALALTLIVRYDHPFLNPLFINQHIEPFTYLFIIWLLVFYIVGLYEIRHLKNNVDFIKKLGGAVITNALISITAFYIFPQEIAPKTNLVIILVIVAILEYVWRHLFNKFLAAGAPSGNVLLIGSGEIAKEIVDHLKNNRQLGYEVKTWMKDGFSDKEMEHLNQIIIAEKINLIVIPGILKKIPKAAHAIYKNIALGIDIVDIASFYQTIFRKVPLDELDEVWFLENLVNRHKIYETVKQPVEIIKAAIILIITLPLFLLIGILVKLTSRGPVFYKQERFGQHEKKFTLYKFRTMIEDAEENGAQWAEPDDKRATPIGKLLRHSHLDEIPQLFNIVKGEVSFVGPRPERPEFVEKLKQNIPHYQLRHLVRPGITGWAQLNYRYGSSVEDAYEKLQFDIYYITHRSFWLDLGIILKTLKLFFVNNK